jgi:hypothetical protein
MEWESAPQLGVGAHGGPSREKLRSLLRGRTLVVVGMVAMLGTGCNNDFFRIGSATDSSLERTFTPSRIATTGAGPKYLGDISGDPGRVSYRTDSEKRMFLLDSTLEGERAVSGGIEALYPLAGDVIRLPASDGETREFFVGDLDPTKTWRSARVYDIGMCSSFASLDHPLGSLVKGIPEEIFQAIKDDPRSSGDMSLQRKVEPILRMVPGPIDGDTGIMRKDADALMVEMRVFVERFGSGLFDCDHAQVDIQFKLIFDVVNRVATNNRECLPSSYLASHCPHYNLSEIDLPRTIQTFRGSATLDENGRLCDSRTCVQCFYIADHPDIGSVRPRLADLSVSVSRYVSGGLIGSCGPVARRRVRDGILEALQNELVDGVERRISGAMLHATLGAFSCQGDCECVQRGSDGRLMPGARWECNFVLPTDTEGTCKLVVEADRVHFRPDAVWLDEMDGADGVIEIVVAENEDDIQAQWLELLPWGDPLSASGCDPERLSPGVDTPRAMSLAWPFSSPPGFSLSGGGDVVTMDATAEGDHGPRRGNDGQDSRRGRGPGVASAPGHGIGADDGQGRGTGDAAAPGRGDGGACDQVCHCLEAHYAVGHGDCMAGCGELMASYLPRERRDVCEAFFEELELHECRDECAAFVPGGGR